MSERVRINPYHQKRARRIILMALEGASPSKIGEEEGLSPTRVSQLLSSIELGSERLRNVKRDRRILDNYRQEGDTAQIAADEGISEKRIRGLIGDHEQMAHAMARLNAEQRKTGASRDVPASPAKGANGSLADWEPLRLSDGPVDEKFMRAVDYIRWRMEAEAVDGRIILYGDRPYHLGYLHGMADAGVPDAADILKAMNDVGAVKVKLA